MRKRWIVSIAVFSIVALAAVHAHCHMWDYSPLTKNQRGEPFKMKRIKVGTDGAPVSLTVPAGPSGIDFDIERRDESLFMKSVSGKDRFGQSWRVETNFGAGDFPSDFYVGDPDKNGINDLVLLVPTHGNGLAPTVHLFSLLFDKKGRPAPFEADGYFESVRNGIDALVDMDHDGKAELIYMNYSDGYWITNIYQCENARWSRIRGNFAGKSYPLFTRFTNKSNRKAVTPMVGRYPFAPDLSNNAPVMEGYLTSFDVSSLPEKFSDAELTVSGHKGSDTKCTPAYWHDSARVVLDRRDGRQIFMLSRSNEQNVAPILDKIVSERLKVLLYGKRYRDKCSPEIVWASESK